MWLTLLAACSIDSSLSGKDALAPFDSGGPVDDPDGSSGADEECNGLDDDGDGTVDEGFTDGDGDGIADCVDPTCPPLVVGVAGLVPTEDTCTRSDVVEPVADPWSTTTRWEWIGVNPGEWTITSGPMVAVTDDTDGDGLLTERDIPAVLVVAPDQDGGTPSLLALDGATGVERWRAFDVANYHQPSVADLTGDGVPEVLVYDSRGYAMAIEPPGRVLWRAPRETSHLHGMGLLTAADLDGDGKPEVITDCGVLEGATGNMRFDMPVDPSTTQLGTSTAVDLDGDGRQEVLSFGNVYDAAGNFLWTVGDQNFHGNWSVPVQADGDPEPEIVHIATQFGVYDGDGRVLYRDDYSANAYAGVPCAADFDGDGETEVAFGSASRFLMMGLDGTVEWETPIEDSSCCGGCSGFDLDGDGMLEVLYNDHDAAYVFDGATGETRLQFPRSSGTAYEYPVVADVDADGTSEILVINDRGPGNPGLYAIAHAGDGWPSLGTTWPLHDFAMTNAGWNGSIPTDPAPFWSDPGVYRARVPTTTALANGYVTFTDACVLDCDTGPAELALQVGNRGLADVPEGGKLSLYALDGGDAVLLETWSLPAIPAGTSLDGIVRSLQPTEIGPSGFRAVVSLPSGTTQCDEEDDVALWTALPC